MAERTEGSVKQLAEAGHLGVDSWLNALGSLFLAWGQRDRTEVLWKIVKAGADRTSLPASVVYAAVQEMVLATLDGRLEAVLIVAEQLVLKIEASDGGHAWRRYVPRCVINARIYLGRAGEVLGETAELPARGRLADFGRVAGPRALALAHLGRTDEAREVLERTSARLSDEEPADILPTANLLELLEAAVLTEYREAAATLRVGLDGLEELCAFGQGASGMCVARHLGAAAALLGEPEQARAYYQQAITVCERVRFRPELALTRLQLAELLLEHYPDERAQALEHLDFAIGEFREMKMQPSLERALKHKGLLHA